MRIPLGLDFPTDWGRSKLACLLRNTVIGGFFVPHIRRISSLEVRGVENLSESQTMIFTANHVSHLDTPLILSALPSWARHRIVVAAAMDTFFLKATKAIVTVLSFNAIPIERHKVNRRSAELAQRLLDEKWHLLIYPEGGRTTTGDLQEFKPGAAYLAERTGAIVVPTFIYGAGELRGPRYAKAPKYTEAPNAQRHHVVVTFGAPLTQTQGENIRKFGVRIEKAVADLGRAVSGDDAYGRRESV